MLKGVTLKGLEVFEALAQTGSIAGAAGRTGLSQPAVSQQLRNLEAALGADLVDHTRRPMQLTAAGRTYLQHAKAALNQLRQASNEVTVMDLTHLTTLSLGVIDDFDTDLTPRLVTLLAETMTRCHFRLITAPSHEILQNIAARRLDMAITALGPDTPGDVLRHPLVRDPFIFVCQKGQTRTQGDVAGVMRALPLLRYDQDQLNGQQIEGWLRQQGLDKPQRFEIGSHLSLMTLAARGAGWAITTPLGYIRAERMHDHLEAHPLPFGAFARHISLLSAADRGDALADDIARTAKRLIQQLVVEPGLAKMPWLEGQFDVIQDAKA